MRNMSNKKHLQANNISLATALDNLNGLPMAEDVKHGKHAWGKYEFGEQHGTATTIDEFTETTWTGTVYEKITYSQGVINVSGKSVGVTAHEYEGGYEITTVSYPYYKSPIDGKVYTNVRTSRNGVQILGEAVSFGKGKITGYAVSDMTDKYPDDGGQGGYWYIKMTSTIESLFGKKFSYGEITKTSTSGNLKVYHGLGTKPKCVLIYPKLNPSNLIFGMGADEPYKIVSGTKYYDPYYGGISFTHTSVPEGCLQRTAEYFEHTKYDVTGTFYWFAIA